MVLNSCATKSEHYAVYEYFLKHVVSFYKVEIIMNISWF